MPRTVVVQSINLFLAQTQSMLSLTRNLGIDDVVGLVARLILDDLVV